MPKTVYSINDQASNFSFFFNYFLLIAFCLIVLLILISVIKYLRFQRKKRYTSLAELQLLPRFGLKHKFAFFNVLLVIFLIISIALPVYVNFKSSSVVESGNEFLGEADKILDEFYQESIFAHIENDIARANEALQNISNDLGFVSAAILGNNFLLNENEGENASSPVWDFIWAIKKTGDIQYALSDEGLIHQRQTMIPNLNDFLRKHNDNLLSEVSYYISKLKTMTEFSNVAQGGNYYSAEILGTLDQANRALGNKAEAQVFSYPSFNVENFIYEHVDSYFFYRPLTFIELDNLSSVVHGAIVVELSLKPVLDNLRKQQRIFVFVIFALIVVIIIVSVSSSYFLAYTVTKPIQDITKNILLITNTSDKNELSKLITHVDRLDEIGVLSSKINDLALLLSKSASEMNDLVIGQDVQKMFIPLALDSQNNKQAISHHLFPDVEFFGYYAGVKSVSGDYFDYFKLDETHYIMIKCDVSGKGISAALIMVEIATMFLNYFNDWKLDKDGTNIQIVVEKISDFLVDNTIPGRFATFMICLLDTSDNSVTVCNAGDNVLSYYCNATGKIESIRLSQTLAAGVMKLAEIPEKMHYKAETVRLAKGDILFFRTDGIEDSRKTIAPDTRKAAKFTGEAKNFKHHTEFEVFGADRVNEIAEAVLHRKNYVLRAGVGETAIAGEFVFSRSDGSIRECVLAIVALETFFRLSFSPAHEDSSAQIDALLDETLKKYLINYDALPITKVHTKYNTVEYTPASLAPQFDDIAMLMVRI